jgi:hypothetical protein
MSIHATSSFELKGWDEQPYDERDGSPKLARAHVTKAFHGDIEGESTLEYLLLYRDDGTASFVGLERVVGRLGERSGSFVLEHHGAFEDTVAKATVSVVPGSGTGELRGLRGDGRFAADKAGHYSTTLDYDFD